MGQLLYAAGYSLQATHKTTEGTAHPDRNAQFEFINERVEQHHARGAPVISVDTKIVSLGPAIAITRVAFGSGASPIQMSLIGRLLGRGGHPLHGDRRRGPGDDLGKDNFSATGVRHYFA